MKAFILISLLSGVAVAADFPVAQYRAMEMKAKALIIGDDLSKAGGRAEKFDAALALQACDGIDKKREAQFKEFALRRSQALKADPGWEKHLRTQWGWDKKLTLVQAIQAQDQKWRELSEVAMPCKDEDSLSLINNVMDDSNAPDDVPFSLCVRMVKALRKSGVCGRPPLGTIVPST